MRQRNGIPAIAVLVGVSVAALLGAASMPSSAGAVQHSHRLVLTPKGHQRLPARQVLIKVRAGRSAKHFRAQLNGHSIGRYFSSPRHHVRRLKASLCYGLRHGHNRLHVRVGKRAQGVGFRIKRNRHLVCAGFDRTTSIGAKVRFKGRHRRSSSRHRRGSPSPLSPKQSRAGARYKWKVVSAPPASETQAYGELKTHGRGATFRPTLPGDYKLRLSVTTGAGKAAALKAAGAGTTASDTTNLTVLPNPQAPIYTMTHDDAGNWGVGVGSGSSVQFYADPGHSKDWVQVVVLDATTTELVDNKSFDCPEATYHPNNLSFVQRCTGLLGNYLDGLRQKAEPPGDPLIVIAVSQPPNAGQPDASDKAWREQPPYGVLEQLYRLGMNPNVTWQHTGAQQILRGTFSVIGYLPVDTPPTYHTNLDLANQHTGDIRGSLLADNQAPPLYSTFVSPEQATFETQAPGSTATTNVMRINGKDYSASIGSGQGGLQMVILNRRDLSPYQNDVVDFNGSEFFETHSNIAHARGELDLMRYLIETARDETQGDGGVLVFITTVGNAQLPPYSDLNDEAQKTVDLLQGTLGASRIRLYKALDPRLAPPDTSYTLIGEPGITQAGEGLEALGTRTSSGLNAAPLSGYLDRSSKDYGFEVEAGEPGDHLGSPGQNLRDLAISEPIDDWPERSDMGGCKASPGSSDPNSLDNDGCEAAVTWIAKRMLGDSNRGLFWTQPYTKEFWDTKIKNIANCTYNGPASSTCNFTGSASAADFQWAQNELEQEISWLENVNGYVSTLAKPFADSLVLLSTDKDSIASRIDNLVQPGSGSQALVEMDQFLTGLREGAVAIAGFVPGFGEAAESVNIAYDVALEWGKVDGEEAGGDFKVKAADVGKTIGDSLQAAQKVLTNQMPDVIVADYTKLRTLGICSELDPSTCPDAAEWQVTQPDQANAEKLVRNSIRTQLYTDLLPAKYQAWRMPISPNRSTNWQGSQPAGQDITGWHCPFHNEPGSANFSYPVRADLGNPGGPNDQWQVIAYANETGAGTYPPDPIDPFVMHLPDNDVTDPLFQPITNDGLGIGLTSAEPFYRRAFGIANTDDFSHFPLRGSVTQWITSSTAGFKDSNCGY